MTDSALLRLAKLVQSLAARTSGHELYDDARRLVDDLEAAGIDMPPAPARRTITREEFNAARVLFLDEDMTSSEVMTAVAAAWRLTVED